MGKRLCVRNGDICIWNKDKNEQCAARGGILYIKNKFGMVNEINEYDENKPLRNEDVPANLVWHDPRQIYAMYFNSSSADWYDLIIALQQKIWVPLRVNAQGDVLIVKTVTDGVYWGFHIERGTFVVRYIHMLGSITRMTQSLIKKDVFSIIEMRSRHKFVGDVPDLEDYNLFVKDVTRHNVKDAVNGCMKMVRGLFDVAISCQE